MGQALEMCVHCENKRGCDTCTDLHNWIMEHLEPKQEWVRAKDRLPEKGKSVLVYWDDGFDIGEYVGGEVGDDIYWMPLPEPPEREGE